MHPLSRGVAHHALLGLKRSKFSAACLALLLTVSTGAQSAVTVVEFYHAGLNHYFRTSDVNEASGIDSGAAGPGWIRTGDNFLAHPVNNFPAGAAPVCRFYGSINPGPNSHFYTSDRVECDGLKAMQAAIPATQKRWNYEGLAFAIVPSSGNCANGLKPVYRLYNNGNTLGIDSNHRYTTLLSEYTRLIANGWKGEGVVMCGAVESSVGPTNPPPTGNPLPPGFPANVPAGIYTTSTEVCVSGDCQTNRGETITDADFTHLGGTITDAELNELSQSCLSYGFTCTLSDVTFSFTPWNGSSFGMEGSLTLTACLNGECEAVMGTWRTTFTKI